MFLFILLAVCATFAQAQTPAPANASSTAVNTSTVPPAANASGSAVNTSLLSQKPENQIPFGASAAPSAKPGAATLNGMTLLNDVLKLAVILVLVYVGLLLYKQYFMHKRGSTATATAAGSAKPQKLIYILETIALGQQRSLHLVQVGGRVLIVGATPQQMTLLGDVTEDAEVRRLLTEDVPEAPAGQIFQQLLGRYLPQDAVTGKDRR